MDKLKWSSDMLKIVHSLDSFNRKGSCKSLCKPFIVDGKKVGNVPPYMSKQLENFKDVFSVEATCVKFTDAMKTYNERTKRMNEIMKSFRDQGLFCSLAGWRYENYNVSESFNQPPLFEMERSAVPLFGIKQYGVHLNGFKYGEKNQLLMWIAQRSLKKPTFPGKFDQIAAGGIAVGSCIKETLIKECDEEASISKSLAEKAIPVGAISYCYEDERGIFPEVEFIYDLEVPDDFLPVAADGEVEKFFCWPIMKVKEKISTGEFKPNCAVIILDFLIRHGVIQPDSEPNYVKFLTGMHKEI